MLVYSVLLTVCVVSLTVNTCNLTRLPRSWSWSSLFNICVFHLGLLSAVGRGWVTGMRALLLAFGVLPLLLELFSLWEYRESSGVVFPRACVMSGELAMELWGLSFSEQKAICQHGIRDGYFSHSRDRSTLGTPTWKNSHSKWRERGGESELQRKRAIQRCLFSQSLACSNPACPQRQGIKWFSKHYLITVLSSVVNVESKHWQDVTIELNVCLSSSARLALLARHS